MDGLVALLHPWESADNPPRFDAALARVDVEGVEAPRRTDTSLVDTAERPTDLDYRRYVALVAALRAVDFRPSSPGAMPFAYVDLLVSAILAVAEDDLAVLHAEIGGDGTRARAARTGCGRRSPPLGTTTSAPTASAISTTTRQ